MTKQFLLHIEHSRATFNHLELNKNQIFDYDREFGEWYYGFTIKLSEKLADWLKTKEFKVLVKYPDSESTKLYYYIQFNNELDSLDYILRFNS
jgi:hypothetical protein